MQIHPQSDPRREIAAYRIDRMLGIGHVPPAKSAVFAIDDVIAAIEASGRTYAGGRIESEGQARWSSYLQPGAVIPVELAPLLAQIATVVVFDVLIDNADRWSGNNTQGSSDGRVLYFIDNTLAFSSYTLGHTTNLSKLSRI